MTTVASHPNLASSVSKRLDTACDYCHLPVRLRDCDSSAPDLPVYCCFGCKFAAQITQAHGERGRATWMLTRLGVAVFLSMSVMIFSLYLYGREIYATPADNASAASAAMTSLMRYASLLFATPVLFLLGEPILRNSIDQWRRGIASTDALVMLGVGAAFVYSYVTTLTDSGQTYFETACMVLVLVTLGRWLEAVAKLRASDAVRTLDALLPETVIVERSQGREKIAAKEARVGDLIFVPAGERIGVDGVVESGRAHIDNKIVTGESEPKSVDAGSSVFAGGMAMDGALRIRATAVGANATVGRMESLLESARQSKSRYERLADRVASWFVPLTVALAMASAFVAFQRAGISEAILTMLAVLLIACPCALGIATPTAVWAALGRAAQMGVMIRNGESIERLASIRAICFDKTGTLTTGIARVESVATDGETPRELCISVAAALAGDSAHVISRSIGKFAEGEATQPIDINRLQTIAGSGVVGQCTVGEAFLGSAAFMKQRGLVANERVQAVIDSSVRSGSTVCFIGWSGTVRGVFVFRESLRNEVARVLRELTDRGLRVVVLTGDRAARGAAISKEVGATVVSELLPDQKADEIARIRSSDGAIAMVGDGINDSPALASADVGLAMGCGADIARDSADICLIADDLAVIPELIDLARQTVRTIRINLFWAFAFNAVGMTLAASGRLSPIFAAGAMVVSSLLVVGNSLRLATVKTDIRGESIVPTNTRLVEAAR